MSELMPAFARMSARSLLAWFSWSGIYIRRTRLLVARVLRAVLQVIAVLLLMVRAEKVCREERLSVKKMISCPVVLWRDGKDRTCQAVPASWCRAALSCPGDREVRRHRVVLYN